uniref:SFRICE_024343 n=1 Tax=Spodoptera frugiperda TaxID=7108 RepID=A0A2H1VGI0_SPOFR
MSILRGKLPSTWETLGVPGFVVNNIKHSNPIFFRPPLVRISGRRTRVARRLTKTKPVRGARHGVGKGWFLVSKGLTLRTASKGSSPPDQNQTRACGALRSARASKSHQTTTDGAHCETTIPRCQ